MVTGLVTGGGMAPPLLCPILFRTYVLRQDNMSYIDGIHG